MVEMEDDKALKTEFIECYRNNYSLVFNRVYKSLGKVEDAEDICHEIFIDLYRNIETVIEPKNWLMTVARNRISQFYRSRGESQVELDSGKDDLSDLRESVSNDLRIVLQQEIDNAENYEDDIDRTVFELIAILRYSRREAALQLNLSSRQTGYRYKRVIKKMMHNLRNKGITGLEDLI